MNFVVVPSAGIKKIVCIQQQQSEVLKEEEMRNKQWNNEKTQRNRGINRHT